MFSSISAKSFENDARALLNSVTKEISFSVNGLLFKLTTPITKAAIAIDETTIAARYLTIDVQLQRPWLFLIAVDFIYMYQISLGLLVCLINVTLFMCSHGDSIVDCFLTV